MEGKFQRITPFFWFDDNAEQAIELYTSIFPNSRVTVVTRYDEASAAASGQKEGTLMTIGFELDGEQFMAINGGPHFQFSPAISLVINCHDQAEVDHYWARLTEGGDPQAQQCGWLKDRFGVSWQVVPTAAMAMMNDPDPARALRATAAVMKMKKLDLATIRRAADGA